MPFRSYLEFLRPVLTMTYVLILLLKFISINILGNSHKWIAICYNAIVIADKPLAILPQTQAEFVRIPVRE